MWRRALLSLRRAAPATALAAVAAATSIGSQSTPCHAAGVNSAVQVEVPKPRNKEAYDGYEYSRLSFVDGKSAGMRGKMEEFILNLQDEICSVRFLQKGLSQSFHIALISQAIEAQDGNKFKEDQWTRPEEGGGGRSRVLQVRAHTPSHQQSGRVKS